MNVFKAMTMFVRVVETGSLSAAGRYLGVSQPAVSQQITALERHLGVQLINRTTRQVALTQAGHDYYRRALSIIEAVDEAGEAVSDLAGNLSGHLRVQAPVGFGQMYLANIAIAFQLAHPKLTVELILDDRYVDLIEGAVDVAIRFGTLPSSGLIAKKLGMLRRIVVASPAYIEAHGDPETPEALSKHSQVRFNGAPTDDRMPLVGAEGLILIPVKSSFLANNAFVLTDALKAGLGLGGVQLPLVEQHLRDGSLVRVMSEYEYAPLEVHAIYNASRFVPAKVRAFIAYIEKALHHVWQAAV